MTDTRAFLTELGEYLAGAGLGLSWNPDALYTAGQLGIWTKLMPAAPDRAVVINVVWGGDDITMPRSQPMIQIRARGAAGKPLDVDDILDPIAATLHGKTNLPLGGFMVVQINRRVVAPLGADESKRWERADQYYADVDVPPTINRPEGGSW